MQVLFILAALPLFSLAFIVFDRSADLRRDSEDRARVYAQTWGALYPLRTPAVAPRQTKTHIG